VLTKHFGTHEPEKIRIWARVAVMRITSVSNKHLDEIVKFLDSPKAEARSNAAQSLAFIGREAKTKTRDLMKTLSDKDPEVVVWGCVALSYMEDEAQQALPALKQLSQQHKNEGVRKAAEEAIQRITEGGKGRDNEKPKREKK
jgi:HEAT repeat protein